MEFPYNIRLLGLWVTLLYGTIASLNSEFRRRILLVGGGYQLFGLFEIFGSEQIINNSIRQMLILAFLVFTVHSLHIHSNSDPEQRYLYSNQSGNLVWGGAMNLAWTELKQNLIKEPIALLTNDSSTLKSLRALNNPVISKDDMDSADYYVKSGYGQDTVDQINREMKEKFPDSSMGNLEEQLSDQDIISYAYFMKKIKYLTKFKRQQKFSFNGQHVKGFSASNPEERKNINLYNYKDDNNFLVSLKLTDKNTQLYLYKSSKKESFGSVVKMVEGIKGEGSSMENRDQFGAPEVHLDFKRDYDQMINQQITNQVLSGYRISKIYEKIKFDMDNEGVKVENEAVIGIAGSAAPSFQELQPPKKLLFDKKYWIIMKNKGKNPFFIAEIDHIE